MIADAGAHVAVAPRVELQMGHGRPATGRALAAGVRPGLSVDVVSGVTGSIFAEMRGTLEAERGSQNDEALAREEWMSELALTSADVIAMATIDGARTLGLQDRVGSLTPGKQADFLVLDTSSPALTFVNDIAGAIIMSDWGNVDSGYVAGEARKRDGRLVADVTDAREAARASRDRLLR
jgi:5-methylthioadenosine/S-adenosylhomocysteine deaminase